MKVIISLTKNEYEHLQSPHTFYDECSSGCTILQKVQKEIDKILKERKK